MYCEPFYLEHKALAQRYPEQFGITNLKFLYNDFFFSGREYNLPYSRYYDFRKAYAFDELIGLKWQEKLNQQQKRKKEIESLFFKLKNNISH
jgi:hypothetical protein